MPIEQEENKNYAIFEGRLKDAKKSVLPEHMRPNSSEWCSGSNQYPKAVYGIPPEGKKINGEIVGTCKECTRELEYGTYGWKIKQPKKEKNSQ